MELWWELYEAQRDCHLLLNNQTTHIRVIRITDSPQYHTRTVTSHTHSHLPGVNPAQRLQRRLLFVIDVLVGEQHSEAD